MNHKRVRLDSNDPTGRPTAITGLRHDGQLWYEDGNVILVASGIGFRVIQQLFCVPQPPDSQLIDGCPVVHLSDTAIALQELLLVLLRGKRYSEQDDPELDFLSYRIRLAHKYGVEDILEESVQALEELYPTSLASWDQVRYERGFTSRTITAVNLARLTNTCSVLPTALYACCQLPVRVLFNGAVHADGTIDTLSPGDMITCMEAKVLFTRKHMENTVEAFFLARQLALAYTTMTHTEAGLLEVWDSFLEACRRRGGLANGTPGSPRLCNDGVRDVRRHLRHHRVAMWNALPQVMGIEVETWVLAGLDSDSDSDSSDSDSDLD
ncbi:uncharacterized protein B0H18DRAFT_1115983 [Fomitopsis serialis]|uniref:uncharacterized protein n=1 Tax=Fomitopsis serialis TaxID=139415 RepID=UPI0020079D15|nr:uncharacterized protein B0H18DRAFT_1115983 [Neoantrodia serialis]KAH9932316.1 hypothetical protein B0H18DRAFT_1115983 [Neoantrodia serialis]